MPRWPDGLISPTKQSPNLFKSLVKKRTNITEGRLALHSLSAFERSRISILWQDWGQTKREMCLTIEFCNRPCPRLRSSWPTLVVVQDLFTGPSFMWVKYVTVLTIVPGLAGHGLAGGKWSRGQADQYCSLVCSLLVVPTNSASFSGHDFARPVLFVHHKHVAKNPTSVFFSDGRTVWKATMGKLLREKWSAYGLFWAHK